jgi:hypothetical protein
MLLLEGMKERLKKIIFGYSGGSCKQV